MKRLAIALVALALAGNGAEAQRAWTLQDCINYALEHNISVKQQGIAAQQAAIELETAKWDRAPGLSGSASQNFSFGRGLSEDNTYVNTNTGSTGFSLGTSVNLFSGFRASETIKLRDLQLQEANAGLLKAQNDISMNVAQAFMQILYDREIAGVARRQIEIDSLQLERLQNLLANGKASQVEISQQRATLEQDRFSLVQAQNKLSISVLTLTQLLELPSPEGFEALPPSEISGSELLESPDSIYAQALGSRPEILAEKIKLQSFDSQIRLAQSALYPSLSLSAGLGSNYYNSDGYKAQSFSDQMKNNFSQYIGINLNIPIFSKFSARNSIRSAELGRNSQALALQNAENGLYKEIQQAYYNALAARSRYYSSQHAYDAAEASFALVQAKYEGGKASITEFNEAKNAALKSESDLLQAKYEWYYQAKLLEFYKGVKF